MTLRRDLILVALPPRERTTTPAGVIQLPAPSIMVDRLGVVLQVGASVDAVRPGARVLFGSEVGEEVVVDGRPCLLLRVRDVDAVIEVPNAR
jgi:co-chaperonin GroES (HSP10)